MLQGIFPTQGSNPGLPHCGQMLLPSEPGKSLLYSCKQLSRLSPLGKNLRTKPGFRDGLFLVTGQSQLADKLVQALEGSSYCRETCRPSLLDSKNFFFVCGSSRSCCD